VAHLIADQFGVDYHPGHVWKILDDLGWSCQRPVGRARERNESRSAAGCAGAGLPLTKSPKRRRTIIFIDESGVSQRPHRVRTWSPRGETPVLQYNFKLGHVPAVAGITFYNFYSRLYKGTVKRAEVVDFLQTLLRHIPGPLLIVWDRLSAHRSRITSWWGKASAYG